MNIGGSVDSQQTGPREEDLKYFLPVIPVSSAPKTMSDLQLTRTEISPEKHSRKLYKQTINRKNVRGNFLPVILVLSATNPDRDSQFTRTEMSPVEWKYR